MNTKYKILFTLAALVALASCSKQDENEGAPYPSFISVDLEQPYKVEKGTRFTISVGYIEGVTYKWNVPDLLSILAGESTNTITVKCMREGEIPAGSISVATLSEGTQSISRKFWYAITITPRVIAIKSSIQGSQTLYPGETVSFSAPEIEGVVSYSWSGPSGFTAAGRTDGNEVEFNVGTTVCTYPRGCVTCCMTDEDGVSQSFAFNKFIHVVDISREKRFGKKTWMLTNLNNAGSDGKLGQVMSDDPTGEKYGRFYSWAEAMTGKSGAKDPYSDGDFVVDSEGDSVLVGYTQAKDFDIQIQGACPQGWHVPNAHDFYDLASGIADDYGLRRNSIAECASAKSGIFMPSNRETKPMSPMNLISNGFVSSYLRGGKPASEGGLWVRNESTITENGLYFYTAGTGAFGAANDYPLYLDKDSRIGFSLMPYGRLEADKTTNNNFGKYSFHWTATVDGGKHYRFTVGFNTCNFSTSADSGVYENLRCVANY